RKAAKTAANSGRPNPKSVPAHANSELAGGEALVSLLDEAGSPTVTERAWIVPPASRMGPIAEPERAAIRKKAAALYGQYEQAVDRESAYEKLRTRAGASSGPGRSGGEGPAGRSGRWGRSGAEGAEGAE